MAACLLARWGRSVDRFFEKKLTVGFALAIITPSLNPPMDPMDPPTHKRRLPPLSKFKDGVGYTMHGRESGPLVS